MNSNPTYTLFGHPVPRRAYYWSWFLCPGLALMIYLSTRSRDESAKFGGPVS